MIGQDSVTIFHYWQAKEILKELITKDYLEEKSVKDSLLLYEKDKQVIFLNSIISKNDSITLSNIDIIEEKDFQIDILNAEIKEFKKKNRNRKIRNWSIATVGVGGFITAIVLK